MEDMLRNSWREVRKDLSNPTGNRIPSPRRKTVLERLVARYRHFQRLEIALMVLMPWCILKLEIMSAVWNTVIIAMYELLMLASFIADNWLASWLNRIDVEKMPVTEVIRRCAIARKFHLRFVIYGLPFSFLTVFLMVYAVGADMGLVIAVCSGGVIGLAVGFMLLREILRDYHSLMSLD